MPPYQNQGPRIGAFILGVWMRVAAANTSAPELRAEIPCRAGDHDAHLGAALRLDVERHDATTLGRRGGEDLEWQRGRRVVESVVGKFELLRANAYARALPQAITFELGPGMQPQAFAPP